MYRSIAIMVLGLTGCASSSVVPRPRAGDSNTRIISDVISNPNPGAWKRSKWYRQELDLTTPGRVYISYNYACVMDFPPVNEPLNGDYFQCPTAWRYPR